MYIKTPLLLYIIFITIFFSCNSSTPLTEKFTGLTLGMPIVEQVKKLKEKNIIHEGEDGDYIIYKGLRGNICYSVYSKGSVDYLKAITVGFENPTIPPYITYKLIKQEDVAILIDFFNSNYGYVQPKFKKQDREGTDVERNWQVNQTSVSWTLSTYIYLGQGKWLSSMNFSYNQEKENELKGYEHRIINSSIKDDIEQVVAVGTKPKSNSIYTPNAQSQERQMQGSLLHNLMDSKFYNQQIKFIPKWYKSNGEAAFLKASLIQANGNNVDFTKSSYKEQFEEVGGDEEILVLFKLIGSKWEIVALCEFPTDVCHQNWWKEYEVSKMLFDLQ